LITKAQGSKVDKVDCQIGVFVSQIVSILSQVEYLAGLLAINDGDYWCIGALLALFNPQISEKTTKKVVE
jgi:hypothetical protein